VSRSKDERFDEVVGHSETINIGLGPDAKQTINGDEVIIGNDQCRGEENRDKLISHPWANLIENSMLLFQEGRGT
jgi:hypothetical protein